MHLRELITRALGADAWAAADADAFAQVRVRDVVQDARLVSPGALFVARRGRVFDGHAFIAEAIAQGAVAVVGAGQPTGSAGEPTGGAGEPTGGAGEPISVPYFRVDDDRAALAQLAATFYGRPGDAMTLLGVTGTDGKTTTSFLLHHLLAGRYRSGLISTAGNRLGNEALELVGHFTTPEAPDLQRLLARLRDGEASHAVIEASSHGFAQRRLDTLSFAVGVWTNLAPEHLDFHGDLAAYLDAKRTLARRSQQFVANRDDDAYEAFAEAAQEVIAYGLHPEAAWRAEEIVQQTGALHFTVIWPGGRAPAELPMFGRFNVHNALAALAAAHACGIPVDELLTRLRQFGGVPGRMQVLQREPFAVVIDFAHTAPALRKALAELRPTTRGRLLLVIGAAGERDPGKRRPLGAEAMAADLAFFTEEDSRSEATDAILAEMAAGARAAGGAELSATELDAAGARGFVRIADRREAIAAAISAAQPGDLVLLAGKGHERTLERRDEVLVWDEAAEARAALASRGLAADADAGSS